MHRDDFHKGFIVLLVIGFLISPSISSYAQEDIPKSPLADQTWVRLGGPLGGLGYDIRMHPENPDIMYVTDALAGVHKSVDGGQTWFSINEGIDARSGRSGDEIPVFCLTIDPNNHDIIWIGTQSFRGVYRSEDGGESWEKRVTGISEGNLLTIRGIAIEPGNSDIVYIAAEIGQDNWGREFDRVKGVVYKSTNAGMSWQPIWRGDNLARYILIDPQDVNTIYLSTGIFDREAHNSNPNTNVAGGEGILKSEDGGKTWTQVNNGLQNLYIGSLFMHPEDSQILIAGAGNNAYRPGGGIYITEDGGEHWQYLVGEQITSVEFATSDPNTFYAAGDNEFFRFQRDPAEEQWQRWDRYFDRAWGPTGIRAGFPIDFQVDLNDSMRIFVNNYGGGNFLSEDGGRTWLASSTGYTGADLYDVSVSYDNPAVVYANGRSGPFVSPDGGISWIGLNPRNIREIAEGARIVVDPNNSQHIIMSSAHQGWTFESPDSGYSWSLVTNFETELNDLSWPDTTQKFQGVQAIAFAPSNSDKVYAGFGVWRCATNSENAMCFTPPYINLMTSEDGGTNWVMHENTPFEEYTITEIVVHPQDANTAWVATAGGGVFKTIDGGITWESASSGLSARRIMTIAIDPNNPLTLYAGSDQQGLFKSEDGGKTWRSSRAGMDANEPIIAIVVDPVRFNIVYAGGWASGVYYSSDYGSAWQKLNDGLRTRSVHDLAISSNGETLYAATRGEGVFRLSTLSQDDFNNLSPDSLFSDETIDSQTAQTKGEIKIDGNGEDWIIRTDTLIGISNISHEDYLDFEQGFAFVDDEALHLFIEVVDPNAYFVQIDISLEVDGRRYLLTWDPGMIGGYLTDVTDGFENSGRTEKSEIMLGTGFEARLDLEDLGSPEKISFVSVISWAGHCCDEPDWWATDEIFPNRNLSYANQNKTEEVSTEERPILVDGYLDDWKDWNFVLMDVEGDSNSKWMDLTHAAVAVDDQFLNFYARVDDPNALITQYDFVIETDAGDFNVMWVPGSISIKLADVTVSYQEIGHADNSLIFFGEAIEGQISFQDLKGATEIYSMRFKTMVDDEGTWTNADWMEATIFKRFDE